MDRDVAKKFTSVVLSVGALLIFVYLIFFSEFSGNVQLIGNSDRLNTNLSMRIFEVNSIRKFGRTLLWDEYIFGGISAVALHYMTPIIHPLSWIVAYLNPIHLIHAINVWLFVVYFFIALSAYVFFVSNTRNPLAACVSSICYVSGYQIWFRTIQSEDAALNYAYLPLACFFIKKLYIKDSIINFYGLIIVSFLCSLSFLQETSYVFLGAGAFVMYNYYKFRSGRSTFICFAGFIIGIIIASPRIITVASDFVNYARESHLGLNSEWEILRIFYEGLFGRNYEEASRISGVHVHEGFQVYSSIYIPLAILTLLPLVANAIEAVLLSFYLIFLIWTVQYFFFGTTPPIMLYVFVPFLFIILSRLGSRVFSCKTIIRYDDDLIYYIFMFATVTFFILIPPLRTMLYYAYLKMDFSHSRLGFLVIFSYSSMFNILLSRFYRCIRNTGSCVPKFNVYLFRSIIFFIFIGFLYYQFENLVLQIIEHSGLFDNGLILGFSQIKLSSGGLYFSLISVMLYAIFFACFIYFRRRANVVGYFLSLLSAMVIVNSFEFIKYNIWGDPNLSYPIPFKNHNAYVAPLDVLNPPSSYQLSQLHEMLEVNNYRSVFILPTNKFISFSMPFISNFWQLRTIDGYVPGVPKGLSRFPFSSKVMGLRTIRHSDPEDLDWSILSFMNVKFAMEVETTFFHNVKAENDYLPFDINSIKKIENPLHVTPRVFFAKYLRIAMKKNSSEVQSIIDEKCINYISYKGDAHLGAVADDNKFYRPSDIISNDGILLPVDPKLVSIIENIPANLEFSDEGVINSKFEGDIITINFTPLNKNRFLVMNENYDNNWMAMIEGHNVPIYRTNIFMRGVVIPANASSIRLRYRPFIVRKESLIIIIIGFLVVVLFSFIMYHHGKANIHKRLRAP